MKVLLTGGKFDGEYRDLPMKCWGVDISVIANGIYTENHRYSDTGFVSKGGFPIFQYEK